MFEDGKENDSNKRLWLLGGLLIFALLLIVQISIFSNLFSVWHVSNQSGFSNHGSGIFWFAGKMFICDLDSGEITNSLGENVDILRESINSYRVSRDGEMVTNIFIVCPFSLFQSADGEVELVGSRVGNPKVVFRLIKEAWTP